MLLERGEGGDVARAARAVRWWGVGAAKRLATGIVAWRNKAPTFGDGWRHPRAPRQPSRPPQTPRVHHARPLTSLKPPLASTMPSGGGVFWQVAPSGRRVG